MTKTEKKTTTRKSDKNVMDSVETRKNSTKKLIISNTRRDSNKLVERNKNTQDKINQNINT